jgi:serine/threonine-protein kinase
MLTGRVPFEAETPMAVVIKHISDPIPMPRRMNPNIPDSVERVLLKALAKNPDDRFSRAGEMAEALRRAVTDLSPAVAGRPIPPDPEATVAHAGPIRPSAPPAATPPAAKSGGVPWLPILIGLGALAVGGICLLAGLFYLMGGPATRAPGAAQGVAANGETPAALPPSPPPQPVILTDTPTPMSITTTPAPVCTPPLCATDEVYFCPDDCPGGCGTECATVTPGASSDSLADLVTPTFTPSPTATFSPTPSATFSPTPSATFSPTPSATFSPTPTASPSSGPPSPWEDTGLRPVGRYADIWTILDGGQGALGYPVLNPVGDRLCARQYFARGYMVWYDSPQDPDFVWAAAIPNAAANEGTTSYLFTDTWPGSPEYWCSEAEARAPLGPRRGFGMLWCEYADLRADIGQAVEEEIGGPDYPRCEAQLFQGGAILHNPLDAKYWVFIDNGGWYRFDE